MKNPLVFLILTPLLAGAGVLLLVFFKFIALPSILFVTAQLSLMYSIGLAAYNALNSFNALVNMDQNRKET